MHAESCVCRQWDQLPSSHCALHNSGVFVSDRCVYVAVHLTVWYALHVLVEDLAIGCRSSMLLYVEHMCCCMTVDVACLEAGGHAGRRDATIRVVCVCVGVLYQEWDSGMVSALQAMCCGGFQLNCESGLQHCEHMHSWFCWGRRSVRRGFAGTSVGDDMMQQPAFEGACIPCQSLQLLLLPMHLGMVELRIKLFLQCHDMSLKACTSRRGRLASLWRALFSVMSFVGWSEQYAVI